jgi:ABC-type Zn uptake system ZnuABC Zn-binding protein ZnuA
MRPPAPLALVILTAALAAGCGDEGGGRQGGTIEVVATTAVAADLVRQVAGDRAEVHELLPRDADPHGYEPRPSDVRELSRADLVVRSGGEIDDWLSDMLESAGGDPHVVTLLDSVRGKVEGDPHWWQNPRNGIAAADAIERALAAVDPAGRAGFESRASRYGDRLRQLDRSISACLARIPRAGKRLVTTHDALGYYARRYGFEVVGALIPSRSSRAQPSAREVERLVDQIERQRVKAIFPESSLSSRLERAVARESGAAVGRTLYADSLGPSGSYAGSLAANTETIVAGLTGEPCRP